MTRKLLWQCNDSLSISIAGIHGEPSIFWLVQMSCTWWVCRISDGHCLIFICYNDGKFQTCRKTFQIWVTNKVPALFHRQHGEQKSYGMAQKITSCHTHVIFLPGVLLRMSRPCHCWHQWKSWRHRPQKPVQNWPHSPTSEGGGWQCWYHSWHSYKNLLVFHNTSWTDLPEGSHSLIIP